MQWTETDQARYTYLKNSSCTACRRSDIDLVLPTCFHTYHKTCFNDQWCHSCQQFRYLSSEGQVNPSLCRTCKGNFNLLACEACQKRYCFSCISQNPLEGCCNMMKSRLGNYQTKCPGCEYTFTYYEMSLFSCKSHESLCNHCWSIGNMSGKCVMGCTLSQNLNFVSLCQHCKKDGIKYSGVLRCLSCVTCYNCQWNKIINAKDHQELKCVVCNKWLQYACSSL